MAMTVFLSHAGADKAAADRLRKRLEEADFKVWFDERNLRAGREAWQKQIEDMIDQVDAFVVYVGSRGVVNWVEAETRYALARAISGKQKLAFVPVLSPDVEEGSKALPGFARQYQAVRDPLNDPVAWGKLVDSLAAGAPPPAEKEPFVGLESITPDRNHLFFGRQNEIGKIVDILTDRNLLLVVGDSGAGKSSLVKAGLIPAWRGNEVGVRRGEHPGDRDWLTITMTPGDDPWKNLATEVRKAAERERGMSVTAAAEYFDLAKREDPDQKMRAMRLNADPNQARVLLVVDQFEELFVRKAISTETRRSFTAFLATLSNPTDPSFAVALTMRADYSNYLNEPDVAPLKERIEAKEARARYYLRSILLTDPDGKYNKKTGADRLREVVTGPLALARVPEDEANALADLVLGDTGGAPSDLALVQFALSATWVTSGGKEAPDPSKLNLLGAYVAVGRVEGALAKAADRAVNDLIQRDIATEEDVWAALIRLGSLVGVSPLRRTAQRAEFTNSRWAAIQYLASQEGRRLVHISGEGDAATAEIAHEALLTQWRTLSGHINNRADTIRLIHWLADWQKIYADSQMISESDGPASVNKRRDFWRFLKLTPINQPLSVLSRQDLKRFEVLTKESEHWLTQAEQETIKRSDSYYVDQEKTASRSRRALFALSLFSGVIAVFLSIAVVRLTKQIDISQENERSALAALTEFAIVKDDPREAALFFESFLGVERELTEDDLLWLDQRLFQISSANLGGWTQTPAIEILTRRSWEISRQVGFIPESAEFSSTDELVVLPQHSAIPERFDISRLEFRSLFTAWPEEQAEQDLNGIRLEIRQTESGFEVLDAQGSLIHTYSPFDLLEPNTDLGSDLSPPYPFLGTPQKYAISQDSGHFAILFDEGRLAIFSSDLLASPILLFSREAPGIFSESFGSVEALGFAPHAIDFLPGTDALIATGDQNLAVINLVDGRSAAVRLFGGRPESPRIIGVLPINAESALIVITQTRWSSDHPETSLSIADIDLNSLFGSERVDSFCHYVLNSDLKVVSSRVEASYSVKLRSFCSTNSRPLRLPSLLVEN